MEPRVRLSGTARIKEDRADVRKTFDARPRGGTVHGNREFAISPLRRACSADAKLTDTAAAPAAVRWKDVEEAEWGEVRIRRKAAEISMPGGADTEGRPPRLTGVALSGGGVRSASFNLGFLQALEESAVLRHVDLLSTVSGGGYAGAFLSSLAQRHNAAGKNLRGRAPELRPKSPSGRQPRDVLNLLNHSQYLNDWRGFLNRYFIGVVLNNLALLSGVLITATAVA